MKYSILLKPTFILLSLKTGPTAILAKPISQSLKSQPCPRPGLHHAVESESLGASSDPAQYIAPTSIQNHLFQVTFPIQNWFD